MSKGLKFLVLVEVLVTFFPLGIGWIILLILLPLQVQSIHELPSEQWGGPALVLYLLIAGPVAVFAMYVMLVYLQTGRRKLSRWAMGASATVGIATLAMAIIPPWDIPLLGIVYLLPLLCALHVLYLGRSYFSANKTMEPTR